MQSHKISVIIPVYNAEKTVANILEKLIAQKYENIEIIAINDGSKDGSLKILKDYSKKDKRVLVVNQSNAGVSAARNVGLSKATGEFVTFIDADDDFSEDLITELVAASSDDIDFVMCGMSINGREIVAKESIIEGHKSIVSYVLSSLLTKNLFYGPYCKLFRRSVVERFNVEFPDKIKYGEDTIFVLSYLKQSQKIAILDQGLYFYDFQLTGLAADNARSLSFRKARTKALSKFVEGNLSFKNFILYIFIRLRWGLALLKSGVRGSIT